MRTLNKPLEIRRGDDYKYHITLIDQETELPIDLSVGVVEFMVKSSTTVEDISAEFVLTVGSGITLVTYTDSLGSEYLESTAECVITHTQTAALTANSYVYDFVYNNAAGERYTAVYGVITMLSQVNKGN